MLKKLILYRNPNHQSRGLSAKPSQAVAGEGFGAGD